MAENGFAEWKNDFLRKFDFLETPPRGTRSGSKKHFFRKTDFPSPDAKKVFSE